MSLIQRVILVCVGQATNTIHPHPNPPPRKGGGNIFSLSRNQDQITVSQPRLIQPGNASQRLSHATTLG